ncbi:TRAP transporter large permease [Acidovorax sp.]|uniref:TRAP transporter large permease n=1 Tax=Acidovorax sp. TaxID=1872122 RepID=UPI00260E843B|nr:TRAP transporter large permease [Acidovorax sp.]
MSAVMMLVFLVLLILSFPVGYALTLGASIALFFNSDIPMLAVVQQMFSPTQSFPMIAIPFFVMSGDIMMSGKLGQSLIHFATDLVARFRGGHAQVSVLGSTLFGGVSGSAVADATALGSVLVPWQKKVGYPPAFCGATIAAASTIDILIPPSIPLILYSLVSNASIGALFLAGILPGIALAVGFLAVCNISARLRGFPYEKKPVAWGAMGRRAVYATPALMMPVFVLVGLRFGVATPTEISTLAVAYALLAATFIYRDLSFKRVMRAMITAGVATGVVMMLIMSSSVVGWMLTLDQVPELIVNWSKQFVHSQTAMLMLINGVLLLAGMFLDLPAAILLLGPLLIPLAQSYGIDLVQLGIIVVINLAIGLYTPPVGTTLFIGATLAKVKIGETVKELVPFYFVALTVLLLFTYVPSLTWRG